MLDSQLAVAERILSQRSSPKAATFWQTSTRSWHHTLFLLVSIHTESIEHAQVKASVTAQWRKYGAFFGLRDNENIITLMRPSTPSDEPVYWKIKKHCYYMACPCNITSPPHHVRVCKGCWRVLYCNSTCQRM